jgi:hypothetical protein
MKFSIRVGFFCHEIQKVPLGHEANEFAMRSQVRKVRDCHSGIVDYAGDGGELLVWAAQKIVEDSKFVHQFKRGGVNGIASKIAQEIGVFFEDLNVDTGTGEQKAQYRAGRAAAGYAARGLDGLRIGIFCRHRENSLVPSYPL